MSEVEKIPPISVAYKIFPSFLPDVNVALRKIVCMLKPTKEIIHDPETGAVKINTITTFKNFSMDFNIGKEFTEDLRIVDGRTCQVCVVFFPKFALKVKYLSKVCTLPAGIIP